MPPTDQQLAYGHGAPRMLFESCDTTDNSSVLLARRLGLLWDTGLWRRVHFLALIICWSGRGRWGGPQPAPLAPAPSSSTDVSQVRKGMALYCDAASLLLRYPQGSDLSQLP